MGNFTRSLASLSLFGMAFMVGACHETQRPAAPQDRGASRESYRAKKPAPGSRPTVAKMGVETRDSEVEPPWIRRSSGGESIPTWADLLDDARYVCDLKCTEDALVALAQSCKLSAKAVQVLGSGQLTGKQLDMLEWLLSHEGIGARAVVPEALEGVDKEILGFDFLAELDELLLRQTRGFVGATEDRIGWNERNDEWMKDVCMGSLVRN